MGPRMPWIPPGMRDPNHGTMDRKQDPVKVT